MGAAHTVRSYLENIGVTQNEFQPGMAAEEQFRAIKRVYLKAALLKHPDKGGDAAEFRALQEAWESLRELYDSGKMHASGFTYYFSAGGASAKAAPRAKRPGAAAGPPPSWEWFAEAAAEAVPGYKVELAKSGRSTCKQKGTACKHGDDDVIPVGEVRVGSMDKESGAYGRWNHLQCWRVPASLWLGLEGCEAYEQYVEAVLGMSQLTICGFAELPEAQQRAVTEYIMDKGNWARRTKNSKLPTAPPGAAAAGSSAGAGAAAAGAGAGGGGGGSSSAAAAAAEPSSARDLALVDGPGGAFIVPRPGVNGALANALQAQKFVLTGLFPELGGGAGLNLGKDRCREMIEAFGGQVMSAVSGKTDYLVVGKEPGASKVAQAAAKGVHMVDIAGLKAVLEGGAGASLATAPQATITSFSAGYKTKRNPGGNGIANKLFGGQDPALAIEAAKVPKAEAKAAKPPKAAAPARKKAAAPKRGRKAKASDDEEEEAASEGSEDWQPKAKKKAAAKRTKRTYYDDD